MMNKFRQIVTILLTLTSVSYPIIWMLSDEQGNILHYLLYLMVVLWGLKGIFQKGIQQYFAFFMSVLLLIIAFTRTTSMMFWYPVLINMVMLIIFGSSLFTSQTMIERFARLTDPNLSLKGIRYTRKVTQIWCLFFVLNGGVTILLILLKEYRYWAVYTGMISYILMGLLMLAEWLVRQRVMRKNG
ncbi:hypothetical protein [Otariodibacter sp.]|uniref:COG4648 family protein n=1 Tax=Otariodibacter sp. TaxID=3030919 RepID=UPI0026124EBC|nr:hypothetical protein [Otariodibacter sp.]